jgi:hypothetical protein
MPRNFSHPSIPDHLASEPVPLVGAVGIPADNIRETTQFTDMLELELEIRIRPLGRIFERFTGVDFSKAQYNSYISCTPSIDINAYSTMTDKLKWIVVKIKTDKELKCNKQPA